MKKSVIFFGLVMLSTITFAQRKADPIDRANKQTERMKTELSLDDVQYKAVKAINEEYAEKQLALRRDSTLSREGRHIQMKTLHQEKEAAIAKMLTDEQNKKWLSYRSTQVEKNSIRMAKYRSEHAARLKRNLSLTDEQTSKIKAIDEEFSAKFHALRTDSTLAKDEYQEKAKHLREEYRSRIKSVLTEEQIKNWEAQKRERKPKKS